MNTTTDKLIRLEEAKIVDLKMKLARRKARELNRPKASTVKVSPTTKPKLSRIDRLPTQRWMELIREAKAVDRKIAEVRAMAAARRK